MNPNLNPNPNPNPNPDPDPCTGFEDFHVFVCAAFLKRFSNRLLAASGEDLMCLLQELPATEWGPLEVKLPRTI